MHYNLVNESMNLKKSETFPKVGMCGTMFCGTDRWPIVVTLVKGKKTIKASMIYDEDFHNNIVEKDGIDYLEIPEEKMKNYLQYSKTYTYRKNYRWMQEGHDMWQTGAIHLGKADEYRDPDF